MDSLLQKLKHAFQDRVLRRRILFVAVMLVVFRLLAAIPIPGVDVLKLENLLANQEFLEIGRASCRERV